MTFALIDSIDILDGSTTRRIALYEGDLTAIPKEHRADILVVSAFPDNYVPTSTSLIGSLYSRGLSVDDLAKVKAHDLRATCGFWLSNPIDGAAAALNVGRIACFEPQMLGSAASIVGDLFRGLFPYIDGAHFQAKRRCESLDHRGDAREMDRAVTEFAREPNGGLIVTAAPSTVVHRDLIIALAARHKLPAVYFDRTPVAEGGLISYGPDLVSQFRQAASYVDRILRGEKPANLPVQAPNKYELVINLKTAKALGLAIPPAVLARADEVIE